MFKYKLVMTISIQVCKFANMQIWKYFNILVSKYDKMQVGNLLTSKNLLHFAPILSLAIFIILVARQYSLTKKQIKRYEICIDHPSFPFLCDFWALQLRKFVIFISNSLMIFLQGFLVVIIWFFNSFFMVYSISVLFKLFQMFDKLRIVKNIQTRGHYNSAIQN